LQGAWRRVAGFGSSLLHPFLSFARRWQRSLLTTEIAGEEQVETERAGEHVKGLPDLENVVSSCCVASPPPEVFEGSLIPETLKGMEEDEELKGTLAVLKEKGQKRLTQEENKRRKRALASLNLTSFSAFCSSRNVTPLVRRLPVSTLQVNIGLYCNQACTHCHVESSPLRKDENMDAKTVDRVIFLLRNSPEVSCLDITGGAPELNAHFRRLVRAAREMDKEVIDRCNLTVLFEEGQADLADFLADLEVTVVASLPCYTEDNVDKQRGRKVFARSIEALKILNTKGYGSDPKRPLHLVYNPGGAFLPPPQDTLEKRYKKELRESHGIVFNQLFCITNMPIKRFHDFLVKEGKRGRVGVEGYMQKLTEAFNPQAAENVMCRSLLSVRWDGSLFDCDFNQQLDIDLGGGAGKNAKGDKRRPLTVWDIEKTSDVEGRKIATESHCFGCTAGAGSSCTGEVI